MKYLVTTDGSEYSDHALSFLAGFPLRTQDNVHVIHVLAEPGGFGESYELYDELVRVRQRLGEKILEEAEKALKKKRVTVTTLLKQGYPYQEIINAAEELAPDLIVMGSRGHSAVESFLLGSITRQIAIHARSPVLVIKPPQAEASKRPMRILFATDNSESSQKAGAMLLSVPFPKESQLTVLHAVESPMTDIPERFSVEISDSVKDTVARVRQKEFSDSESLVASVKAGFEGRFETVSTLVRPGPAAAVITEQARALGVDLLVVGSRGKKGVAGMLGSVTRRMLSHADCSVLVAKLSES